MLVVLAVTGVFTSCSPDDYSLASPAIIPAELVEGISYTVTPDPNNPNILVCKSDLGAGRNVAWQTPFGLTKGDNVTLQIPFPGEYEVKFGVDTGNGFVWGAPFKFTVSDICTDFISGETWEMLAGGVGKSKTWVYDNGQVLQRRCSFLWRPCRQSVTRISQFCRQLDSRLLRKPLLGRCDV